MASSLLSYLKALNRLSVLMGSLFGSELFRPCELYDHPSPSHGLQGPALSRTVLAVGVRVLYPGVSSFPRLISEQISYCKLCCYEHWGV